MSEAPRLDDLDRAIIDALKRDARATNRAIAEKLRVTEQTVAARTRRLEEADLLRVMAIVDARAAGYSLFAIAGVKVSGRTPKDVALEISALPSVIGVSACIGGFELIVSLYARDERDLFQQLERHVGAVRGVEEIESFLVLERVLHRTDWATLAQHANCELPPISGTALDPLDRAIVQNLQENARTSLREVGRRLGRSEGTIRARLRHIEDAGLCRFQAVTDVAVDAGPSIAWIALKARRGWVKRVADSIARLPSAAFVGITLGRFDVIALIAAPDRTEMARIAFETVALLSGVQRIEVWESLTIHKHDFRIAELSASGAPPGPQRKAKARKPRRRGATTR